MDYIILIPIRMIIIIIVYLYNMHELEEGAEAINFFSITKL